MMDRPVLLATDEDPDLLEAVEAQLVQRYAHDYRVEALTDRGEALATLEGLAGAGAQVLEPAEPL